VTDEAALPLIARHGLLSAEALCGLFEVPDSGALLAANRARYVTLRHPVYGEAALRRQKMHDAGLAPRLGLGLTPACWRRFINAHVFFWVSHTMAARLAAAEPARRQVVLALRTAVLVEAGVRLAASPVNGRAVPRMPASLGPRREPALYRDVASLGPDEPVKEVALPGGVAPLVLAAACHEPLARDHAPAMP
jgi:hypothetical protein